MRPIVHSWEEVGVRPDYYSILDVKENATENEIKKSYRKIAKRYHPDANPGDHEAEQKFKEVSEAYAVLGDVEKRKIYDNERSNAHRAETGQSRPEGKKRTSRKVPGFDFNNMSSNFEQFFGFRPGTSQVDEDKLEPNKKTKTNPIDMTEMFERYMGIKK